MNDKIICTRCIMDTSIPDIRFDKSGVCNYCQEYKETEKRFLLPPEIRKQTLERLLEKIKKEGQNKDYDCIIGVSGGVDSTYVAFLTKEYGLRPLAVHLDNGWDSELSVSNIEKALKILDIDLYTHVINWEEFKDLQLSFLRSSITNIEIPTDHAIIAILYRKAFEEKIRYVITGNNIATEAIAATNWGEYNKDLKLLKSIHKKYGKIKLKTFPKISLLGFAYYILFQKIKYIPILDYLNYDKKEAIDVLQSKLCWEYYGGKHYESIFTRFFQGYILPEKYKVDKRLGHLSTLIMSGQISRDEALEEIKSPLYPNQEMFENDYEYFLDKFGLSQEEFKDIMKLPIKSSKDYSSNTWIFRNFSFLINSVKIFVRS